MDQAPSASLEALEESDQNGGRGKKAENLQGIGKDQGKKITSSDPKEKAPGAAASQTDQTVDSLASKTKA